MAVAAQEPEPERLGAIQWVARRGRPRNLRNALAVCAFFVIWLGTWSAAWLAGLYFFGEYEISALIGGFSGCVGGAIIADLLSRGSAD
jgi:hypothetical protein